MQFYFSSFKWELLHFVSHYFYFTAIVGCKFAIKVLHLFESLLSYSGKLADSHISETQFKNSYKD